MADPSADLSTAEGIEEELTFTDILIDTLDPHSDSYTTQRAELEAKKAYLRQLLTTRQPDQPFGHDGTDQLLPPGHTSDPSRDMWWQAAMNGRPGSTHSSSDASSGFTSGSPYGTLFNNSNSTKRPRPQSSSYLDPCEQQPSKRRTPEPSTVGTPASSDGSYDLGERPSQIHERALNRQLAAEAAYRRRLEAQRADHVYAHQLGQQANTPNTFASNSSSLRPAVQTTLNYNGTYQRPPPPVKPEPSSSRQVYHGPPNGLSASHGRPVKLEPGAEHLRQLPQRPRQDPQVVDLTGIDSDEEIEEVFPTNFTPNRRQSAAPIHRTLAPVPYHAFAPLTVQQPTSIQMPGSYPRTNAIPHQHVYGGNGVAGGETWLGSFTNGISNGLAGPLRHLNEFVNGSSSSRPFDLDNDDDDVVYGGSRRLPEGNFGKGNYAGNEDLYRDRYDAIAAYDSTKTREEIQALLENIRPDEELPAHLRVQTPEALAVKLHKYQELGLTWLKKCEEGSNKGGILADDMGLGKTVQMLSLIVTRKSDDPRCKTTLIVAPVALMRQWAQEIRSKLKPGKHQLTVFLHHGTRKAKSFADLRTYDVVLTTYGSIASELRKREKFELRKQGDPNARPFPAERCVFLGEECHWYRVVLDEAQYIKNRNTLTSRAACFLSSSLKWCLSGTPMQNSVEEFYSLIRFLKIRPFCRWEKFRVDINQPLRSGSDELKARGMQALQALCRAVMLRRTKKSYFEGEPILVLPERTTHVSNPVFDDEEMAFYKALENKTQLDFNKYVRRGTVGRSYTEILVLLLRLRQACCHPHLIKDFGVASAADLSEDQMIDFAKQLAAPVVARIKDTKGSFECPVCYDVTPNPAIFIPCGHDTCSECFSKIADSSNAVDNGEEGGRIRCPNCRGPIDPKRLTDFQSFKKVHMPELLSAEERADYETDELGDDEDEEVDDDESANESDGEDEEEDVKDPTLGGFIVTDDVVDSGDEIENDPDQGGDNQPFKTEHMAESFCAGGTGKLIGQKKKSKGTGKGKEKAKDKARRGKSGKKSKKLKSAVTLAELKKMASRSKHAKKAYLHRLRKEWVSSAKIEKAMEILSEIMHDPEREKVLIFSQWTSLLDLLEVPIDEAGFGYRRYDGSMSPAMRGDAVDDFRDDSKNVRIMLISLKAGNAGLNLNMANHVIILDPFWNPYVEEQAIDRAHRFGQMRPVKVHRLLIEETVEDRIIALQEKKRALIEQALDEQQGNALSRLSVQDLAFLFGMGPMNPSAGINHQQSNRR